MTVVIIDHTWGSMAATDRNYLPSWLKKGTASDIDYRGGPGWRLFNRAPVETTKTQDWPYVPDKWNRLRS